MVAALKCCRCGKEFVVSRIDAKWCPECRIIRAKERCQKYDTNHQDVCPKCGGLMSRRATYCTHCINTVRKGTKIGADNPNWKQGKTHAYGYTFLRVKPPGEPHPYVAEHRVVWEAANGKIPLGWVIHHLNGDKGDNRLENLIAMPRKEHNPRLIVVPYQKRILELEGKLNEQTT